MLDYDPVALCCECRYRVMYFISLMFGFGLNEVGKVAGRVWSLHDECFGRRIDPIPLDR